MTEEEIKKSVLSAYDSVNLINELELLEEPEQADIDTIERNKKHITIDTCKCSYLRCLMR